MSASTVTELVTDELRHEYKATLLQIKKHLTNDQQEELCFYYTAGLTTAETTGILKLFRSLENLRKISWEDVGFLKKGLHAVSRLDLAEILTRFENKRDLTELVCTYAGMKQGFRANCGSESVEQAAKYLVKMVSGRLLVPDGTKTKNVPDDFREEIESDPYTQLTWLVVRAGEIVADSLAGEDGRQVKTEFTNWYWIEVEELCCQMRRHKISWVSCLKYIRLQ